MTIASIRAPTLTSQTASPRRSKGSAASGPKISDDFAPPDIDIDPASLRKIERLLDFKPGTTKRRRQRAIELIAEHINAYRAYELSTNSAPRPKAVRSSLMELQTGIRDARHRLGTLDQDTKLLLVKAAGRAPYAPDQSPLNESALSGGMRRGTTRLGLMLAALDLLDGWIATTIEETPQISLGRPSIADLIWLATTVGSLYERYSGKTFNRRTKGAITPTDLVSMVVSVAAPDYERTPHAIDNLMREAMRLLRVWELNRAKKAATNE